MTGPLKLTNQTPNSPQLQYSPGFFGVYVTLGCSRMFFPPKILFTTTRFSFSEFFREVANLHSKSDTLLDHIAYTRLTSC